MAKVAVRRSAFEITDIPNVALHLDANAGVYVDAGATLATDGQTVQRWADASGAANHAAQATVGLRPTYRATGFNGPPSLQFASNRLETPTFFDASYDAALTVFLLCAGTSGIALSADEWGMVMEERDQWEKLYGQHIIADVARNNGAQTTDGNNYRCIGYSFDGATWRTMVNGQLVKRAATGGMGLAGHLSVGAMSVSPCYFAGHIAEVVVWRYAASDAQFRRISNYLLTRWGLALPSPRNIVMTCGDSMTFDWGTPSSHYPGMIAAAMGTTQTAHNTYGLAGASLSYLSDLASAWIDVYVDTLQTLRINTIWAGTNDLGGGTTAQRTYDLTVAYCAARRTAGWNKLVVFTVLPRSPAGDVPGFETRRQEFNTLLRANWASFADGLADVAADSRIGDEGDELDTTYYLPDDRVHLNQTGQAVVAGILQPVIEGLL